jgi:DNA-binding response OmpR family regulator
MPKSQVVKALYDYREFVFDHERRRVYAFATSDHYIELTGAECDVMKLLVEAHGHVVTYEQFATQIPRWQGYTANDMPNTLAGVVHRLRNKLGEGAIWTVESVGYAINPLATDCCPTCGRVC